MGYNSPNSPISEATRIFKRVRQKAVSATLATLEGSARTILSQLDSYRKYRHITGNTWTSTTVGIYYKGQLKSLFNKGADDEAPTRVTLRAGERYDLPRYYKGELNKGYVGGQGRGGQWGPTLGPWHMRRHHVPKRATWCMVVMIPVSYAGYNPHIVETLQNIMDGLPEVMDCNIVTVDRAAVKSGLFDDVPF